MPAACCGHMVLYTKGNALIPATDCITELVHINGAVEDLQRPT